MYDSLELLQRLMLDHSPPVDQLTECFRSLRNKCAGNTDLQNELGEQESVLKDTNTAIGLGLSAEGNEEWTLCLRISAQFLGNLIVNNPKNQQAVWTQCCSQLKKMACYGDTKLTNICLMVLYNILLGSPNLTKEFANDVELVKIICENGAEGLEFAQYIVEYMLSQDVDWTKVYTTNVTVEGRLFLLEVIEEGLKQPEPHVPGSLVMQLASQFCRLSDCILRTVTDRVDSLAPAEVATLLRLLASCSAQDELRHILQDDRNFFINCAFLLKSIHMAGKEQDNCFTAIPKLSEANNTLQSHPAFGFKAGLVRVLGNLCWRHKYNQDMLKELDIIPLLLDCCNIDARNPFIIQWVVLAVRNLCEGNLANQAVVAAMSREGIVQSAVLTELGLTLHADGQNEINIIPLASLSN